MFEVELPPPALVVGTKLLPYEERHFGSEYMAVQLGYSDGLRRYYSEAQVRALLATTPKETPQ